MHKEGKPSSIDRLPYYSGMKQSVLTAALRPDLVSVKRCNCTKLKSFVLSVLHIFFFLLCSFMGRSVIDLPPKVVHECISANENAKYWDKYVVVSPV